MDEKTERTEQDREQLSTRIPAAQEKDAPVEEDAPLPESPQTEEPVPAAEENGGTQEGESTPCIEKEPDEEMHAEDTPLTLAEPEQKKAGKKPAEEEATAPAPGPAAKIFRALSFVGLPMLIVLAAAMTFLEVWQVRDLWFSDEVRLADAFMNVRNGDWLMLIQNGLPYPDKPPLYFWFMEALCKIPGVGMPMVFFLTIAISHALFICSIWLLARGTGHDRKEAFASGLVALSCIYISGAGCYPRMDLFFAAAVTLGMTCLYRGWIKPFAPFWLSAGFVLMGVATLIKSPLGIAFAVAVSILFLIWRGTPGRLNGRDGLPGFLLMLLVIAAWLGVLYLEGHDDYVRDMLGTQLAGRVLGGGHHAEPWWYYLATIPIIWAPWILIILFVNWVSALRGIPNAWKTRKENGGSSWLWIWFVLGAAMLSCVQAKIAVYALPLLAPLAVLTARSLLRLSPGRSRFFFSLVSVVFAVSGLALVLADVFPMLRPYIGGFLPQVPAMIEPWLETLHGVMYMGGILVLIAVALLFFTRLSLPEGALLVTAVGMVLLLQPYHLFVAPSMSKILSPRAQAAAMAQKMKEGYAPAAFHVYPGAYAWHINELLPQAEKRICVPDLTTDEARDAWLKANPKAVLVMPQDDWNAWVNKPAGAEIVLTAFMVHKNYVVAAVSSAPAVDEAAQENSAASDGQNPMQENAAASDGQVPAKEEIAAPSAQENAAM